MESSIDTFNKLLDKYKVDSGNTITHTSLGNPMGSFYIPFNKYNEFIDVYKNVVNKGHLSVDMQQRYEVVVILGTFFLINSL